MTQSVFVTIAGRTNAGKSSLLNAFIGEKIASVTPKSQTTRTRITGIKTEGSLQMVFMDTPGLHKPTTNLGKHMVKSAEDSVEGADLLLYVLDCTKDFYPEEISFLNSQNMKKNPCILVLNKIDLLKNKEELMRIMLEASKKWDFSEIVPVSVAKNDGLDDLLQTIKGYAKDSPHYFPDDKFTDQPERVIASEIVREKLMLYLRDEVPHGIAVGIEKFKERTNKSGIDILDIESVIYCERQSHKAIIIGRGGSMLKKISTSARCDLEDFFQIKVNLKVWVKISENWRSKENMIHKFGLD